MREKIKRAFPYAYIAIVILVAPLFRLSHISQRNSALADYIREYSNMVPLHEIIDAITKAIQEENIYYIVPLVFNLVAMIPVGVFCGYFFKQINIKVAGVVCIRYAILLAIMYGIRILLKMGSFDIDDILLNIVGLALGMFLASQGKSLKLFRK